MHPDFNRADRWSPQVIGAAIEVHRDKGPGLLESIYKRCLMHELALRQIPAVRELIVPITYKDLIFEESLRLDLYVDRCLIIEAKAVEIPPDPHCSALELHASPDAPVGLLINFHESVLKNGVRRLTLKGADQP